MAPCKLRISNSIFGFLTFHCFRIRAFLGVPPPCNCEAFCKRQDNVRIPIFNFRISQRKFRILNLNFRIETPLPSFLLLLLPILPPVFLIRRTSFTCSSRSHFSILRLSSFEVESRKEEQEMGPAACEDQGRGREDGEKNEEKKKRSFKSSSLDSNF